MHGGVGEGIAAGEDVALGDFADAGDGFQFVHGGEADRGKIGQGVSRGKRDRERVVGGVHSRKIEAEVEELLVGRPIHDCRTRVRRPGSAASRAERERLAAIGRVDDDGVGRAAARLADPDDDLAPVRRHAEQIDHGIGNDALPGGAVVFHAVNVIAIAVAAQVKNHTAGSEVRAVGLGPRELARRKTVRE